MQFVYVLISSENDFYSEQALLSIYSLKKHNSDAFVIMITDMNTYEHIKKRLSVLIDYVDEFKFENFKSESNKERSRILKTRIPNYVVGDFIFLDCDTVICEKIFFVNKNSISAVLDTHKTLKQHTFSETIIDNYRKNSFIEAETSDFHYNSGVMFCRDTKETRQFFKEWEKFWKISRNNGLLIDQLSFNQANVICHNLITEIDGEWNCQLIHGGVKFLSSAKVIHYFSSIKNMYGNPYLLNNIEILESIRDKNSISLEVENLLDFPRNLIEGNSTLLGNKFPRLVVYQAPVREMVYLYLNHPKLYFFWRMFFSFFSRFHKC